MQNILFAIFAHPDDEAFGPAGTLLKLKNEQYNIHLILLTDGEAGINIDSVPDLGKTRLEEWQASARILDADSTHALHHPDGSLEKTPVTQLDQEVTTIISKVLKEYAVPIKLSFMSFEPHGLTGHRDHIAASQLTSRMAKEFNASETWYFCLDSTQAPLDHTAYYEPRAREDSYISDRIDVSAWVPAIYQMIDAHPSQRKDGARRKALGTERLSTECFCIETNSDQVS